MGIGCRGDRSWSASGVADSASPLEVRGVRSGFGEVVGFNSIDKPRTRLVGVLPTAVLPLHFSSPSRPRPPMPLTRVAVRLRDVSAGDGDALRSLFVVALMRFFPTCIIALLSATGARGSTRATNLVVDVLCPPFRDHKVFESSVKHSPRDRVSNRESRCGGKLFGLSYLANFIGKVDGGDGVDRTTAAAA